MHPTTKLKKAMPYTIQIIIPDLEIMDLQVHSSLKVSEVKIRIEYHLGLPTEMYTLSYLDKADLLTNSTLSQNVVVPGGLLHLRPWRMWTELILQTYRGQVPSLAALKLIGDDEQSKFRASMALYIASHRGHYELVERILRQTHVSINSQTKTKWTALHAASRMNRWKCLCILLDKEADITLKSIDGHTPLDVARKNGSKKCEQSLNFCAWNLSKYHQLKQWRQDYNPRYSRDLHYRLAHQAMDSSMPAWLKSSKMQRYPVVYDNPITIKECRNWDKLRVASGSIYRSQPNIMASCATQGEDKTNDYAINNRKFDYGWFDRERAKEFIPSTKQIIMFSDPVAEVKRVIKQTHSHIWTDVKDNVWVKPERVTPQSHNSWLGRRLERKVKEYMEQKRKCEIESEILEKKNKERKAKSESAYLKWINSKRQQNPKNFTKCNFLSESHFKSCKELKTVINESGTKDSLENGRFYVTCVHRPHTASSDASEA